MVILHRPALLSAIVLVLMALGIHGLLGRLVLPRMLERGNVLMLREVVRPLESYFADCQEWPAGTAEETMWRLQGAKNDLIGEKAGEDPMAPAGPDTSAPAGEKTDPTQTLSVRRQRLMPSVNYLHDANLRSAGLTLADAWSRPLEFTFIADGPATVTSLGPDGVLGTADDVMATANIVPRKTQPTRSLFAADREFRRLELLKRLQHARRLADKAK